MVSPSAQPERDESQTATLGMIIALASFAMLFAALLLAYVLLRTQNPIWPPLGSPPLPVAMASASTLAILLSSGALIRGSRLLTEGQRDAFVHMMGAALGLGLGFLLFQVRVWMLAYDAGLGLSGIFGSVVYTLTFAHAAHVVAGVGALAWLYYAALQGRVTPSRRNPVQLVSMFWHFLAIVWVCMFVGIFVL